MKLICSQSDFSTNLTIVSRVVPSRPSHPVLGNVLLKADNSTQRVSLTGFDLSLGIQTSFSAQIETGGMITLPAKLLNDIVSRLPEGELVLEQDEESIVTLTCSSGRYQVRGLDAGEYPELPMVEDGQPVNLAVEMLLEGLKGALFATSADETKQVLTGVHLTSAQDSMEFAATDGHRLAVVQTIEQAEEPSQLGEAEIEVTVPAKTLRELERLLQHYQSANAIALRLDPSQVIFELGDQRVTSRLLEGQYPNYRQLVPAQFSRQVTVERKLLISALERIAVLADQKNNIVKLFIDGTTSQLTLSVEAQDVGSGRETVPVQISGDDLEIAFNVRYLLDGLKALSSSEIQIQCNSSTSPAVLIPVGGIKMTYLVMPVQVRS
jgi:DNA polymerase-3 subunit beta